MPLFLGFVTTAVSPGVTISRKVFIPALAGEASVERQSEFARAPRHYWCNRTLTEVGPDDQGVHPQVCQADCCWCELLPGAEHKLGGAISLSAARDQHHRAGRLDDLHSLAE